MAELSPEELEGLAARLAVPQLDAKRLAVLEEILRTMDETEDADAWIELNYRFYFPQAEASPGSRGPMRR